MGELQERLRHCSANTKDEYLHELAGRAADELDRLTAEVARHRAKLELTPENVEKAARALCRNDYESDPDEPLGRIEGDQRKYVWELYADDATAAIKALSADQ